MVKTYGPYASALFELGKETDKEQLFMNQLENLKKIWESEADFCLALEHPKIKKEEKKQWLTNLFEKETDPVLFQFLLVLNEHGVVAHLPQIYEEYVACYREDRNIERVVVESAADLESSQISALTEMLEKKLNKKIELVIKVNPALIAGLRIQAQDVVLDNTFASRLERMQEKLSEK